MVIIPIPFRQKNNKNLNVLVTGGTHPYRGIDESIKQRTIIKNWKPDECFLAPEWAERVYFIHGDRYKCYSCEGKDVYLGDFDYIQRLVHRKNHIKETIVSEPFRLWWAKIARTGSDAAFNELSD